MPTINKNERVDRKLAVVAIAAFALIYIGISPWRHPYFNSPFCLLLIISLTAAVLWVMRAKLDSWKGILAAAFATYAISVFSALLTWALESSEGLERALQISDAASMSVAIFGFSFLTYSWLVAVIVLTAIKLTKKKNVPGTIN